MSHYWIYKRIKKLKGLDDLVVWSEVNIFEEYLWSNWPTVSIYKSLWSMSLDMYPRVVGAIIDWNVGVVQNCKGLAQPQIWIAQTHLNLISNL